jgi:alpha-D-ribose 1-methylphosphonate 5-triphosphate diphosphatase
MQTILSNARVVLSDTDFLGSVVINDGHIEDITSRRYSAGIDLHGAILAPGVIDIHTDYLERELAPRPSARFPLELALHMVDLRALHCGLTTIASAARISTEKDGPEGSWRGDGLKLAKRFDQLVPTLRANHLIHVRWATNFESVEPILDELLQLNCIANLVFNDDTPGERQYPDIEGMIHQMATRQNISIEEARQRMQERIDRAKAVNNRHAVRDHLAGRLPLGSHDDTTVEHVIEAHESGATLSEMPCTIEAARKARELGMMICMGAPNYYRGGSHCGNLSCHDALEEGLVDILCSDYHFPSLLACALRMVEAGMPLSSAMRLLTLNPARHLGLDKLIGSIELGKRADLVAFHPRSGYADVAHVWVRGVRQLVVGDPVRTAGQDNASAKVHEEVVVA